MRLGRLILLVATLVTILVLPFLARDALQALTLRPAYAAAGGFDPARHVYENSNDEDDDDNDNEVECFLNQNSNEEVPCDFDHNDNRGGAQRQPRRSEESRTGVTKCFDTREVGIIQLGSGSYDVTVAVMPHSSFGQTTRMTLRALAPASIPAAPGSLVDRVVFALDAQSSCDGAPVAPLPNLVNLGITYNVPVALDKSRLQIARLEGGSWVNVNTVPDPVPGNPYVSATIGAAGIYTLFQR